MSQMLHDSVLLVWPCSPAASDQAVYFKCEFKKNGHCVCPVLFNLPADMSLSHVNVTLLFYDSDRS